jgi:hypothetical protein
MKASDYVKKRKEQKGSKRDRIAILERKNWHLTQILGAILFASDDPEKGFTFLERDALSVDIKDVEFCREEGPPGKAMLTVRIKDLEQRVSEAS